MANELSRLGERPARAREGVQRGAGVWIVPPARPARRAPNRAALVHELARDRREPPDADARDEREPEPATLVAIHVEVRHPTGGAPSRHVIEAQADESSPRAPDVAGQHPAESFEVSLPAPLLAAAASAPAPSKPELSGGEPAAGRVAGVSSYVAARALSAYLTHRSFAASPREPRLSLRA